MPLRDMSESCGQCGFLYARVDTEAWGIDSARRAMCPVCGWTAYEEYNWESGEPVLVKRNIAKGHGAFRLIPPGGYSGYNAFHLPPSISVLSTLKGLLSTEGWKGYISIWSEKEQRAYLIFGSPLDKFTRNNDRFAPAEHEGLVFSPSSAESSFTWSRLTKNEFEECGG